MAKKSSVHQSAPPPAASNYTRVTRSQSAEPRDSMSSGRVVSRRSNTQPTGGGGGSGGGGHRNAVEDIEEEEQEDNDDEDDDDADDDDGEEDDVEEEDDDVAAMDNDLTAVAELEEDADLASTSHDVANIEVEGEDFEDAQLNRLSLNRLSVGTGISGTTAKTAFSQEEAEQLRPQDIIDDLEDLTNASEKLANFVAPQGSDTSLESWKSINKDRLAKLTERLALYKKSFGSSAFGRKYISVRTVLRTLFGTPDPEQAQWRPDDILYRVNLIEMISTLLSMTDARDKHDSLRSLDSIFAVSIAGPEYDENALSFWCHLVTQLTIATLDAYAEDPDVSAAPSQVIQDLFYSDRNFKHEESFGLHTVDAPIFTEATEFIEACRQSILESFEEDEWSSSAAALLDLRYKNPWATFIKQALEYYVHRKDDLSARIAAAGEVDDIVEALTKEVQRRADIKHNENFKRRSLMGATPRKSWFRSSDSVAALKQQERMLKQQASTAPVARTTTAIVAPAATVPVSRQDPGVSPSRNLAARARDNADRSSQAAPRSDFYLPGQKPPQQAAALRSLMDRQPNAERLNFDDGSQSQATSGRATRTKVEPRVTVVPVHSSNESRNNKRRADDDFEPTQDVGFEVDERDTTVANKRRREIANSSNSSSILPTQTSMASAAVGPGSSAPVAHPMAGDDWDDTRYPPASPVAGRPPSTAPAPTRHIRPSEPTTATYSRPRKNPGSAMPPLSQVTSPGASPPPSTASRFARAKIIAKQNRVARAKPAKIRNPWSEREELRLELLIETHCDGGISYADLKNIDLSQGNVLAARTSEDIRFKARNMKMTYLTSHGALPRNWEKVLLDKKYQDRLAALGIDYEQDAARSNWMLEQE